MDNACATEVAEELKAYGEYDQKGRAYPEKTDRPWKSDVGHKFLAVVLGFDPKFTGNYGSFRHSKTDRGIAWSLRRIYVL